MTADRVAIIGGGVIGLLCAHHLTKRGVRVVLLERGRVGHGCSFGNAGWVTPSLSTPLPAPGLTWKSLTWLLQSDSPLYIKPTALPRLAGWLWRFRRYCNTRSYEAGLQAFSALNRRTMTLYQELVDEGVPFETDLRGLLFVYRDTKKLAGGRAEAREIESLGYGTMTEIGPDQLAELEPALARGLAGGFLLEGDRVVEPASLCAGVASCLVARGVDVREEFEVDRLVEERGKAVAAIGPAGEVEADAFLIATGAEAGFLSRMAGMKLPVQAGKGYSITVHQPETQVRHLLYLTGPSIGVSPYRNALRIAGTMELSGVNLRFDRRRAENLAAATAAYVNRPFEGASREEWVGMRPVTPDSLPILGKLPNRQNVYVATGHQMLGVTLAPSTGKVMADLIVDGTSEIDLGPFAPDRFG